jgi:hypothetical protein
MMTDDAASGEAAVDRRSAAFRAQEIRAPMILFNGSDDPRVHVKDSLGQPEKGWVALLETPGHPVEACSSRRMSAAAGARVEHAEGVLC